MTSGDIDIDYEIQMMIKDGKFHTHELVARNVRISCDGVICGNCPLQNLGVEGDCAHQRREFIKNHQEMFL